MVNPLVHFRSMPLMPLLYIYIYIYNMYIYIYTYRHVTTISILLYIYIHILYMYMYHVSICNLHYIDGLQGLFSFRGDYDRRTAIHIAAAEGNEEAVLQGKDGMR